ncbi:MAG: FGGY-family carbohydrate kinase, partial [Chloroflexota bacterium]
EEGVRIDGVIALGGVAKKSPFVMQIVADVLNMPIKVARSEQACALGSAMAAAVVSLPRTAQERGKDAAATDQRVQGTAVLRSARQRQTGCGSVVTTATAIYGRPRPSREETL